jgi:3-dehydroshikimate dehydratase
MMKLAAFADEISPDLNEQIRALLDNGVGHIELRGAYEKNVLDFDKNLRAEVKNKLAENDLRVLCIASPIGKVRIDEPWERHFERFKIAVELAEYYSAKFIRIFSYYPPQKGQDMHPHRAEVLRRMRAKVDYIKTRDIVLLHENEKEIYGAHGKDCVDLLQAVDSPKLRSAFDFANFIQEKEHPLDNWPALKPYTVHIHVKDAQFADGKVVPAGQGDGQIEPILVDLYKSGYTGFLSLEPHLKAAGQFDGFSGPTLFKVAVDALKALCAKNGIALQSGSVTA